MFVVKTCSKCKVERDRSLFNKRSASKDGLSPWCKPCFAAYEKERWQNGDDVRKKANKARTVEKNQASMLEFLKQNNCVDCGESDPVVLTFDHRDPTKKTRNISEMFTWSWKSMMEEISKCDVRCANCHMKRTANQFGFWKTKII